MSLCAVPPRPKNDGANKCDPRNKHELCQIYTKRKKLQSIKRSLYTNINTTMLTLHKQLKYNIIQNFMTYFLFKFPKSKNNTLYTRQ